MSEEQQNDDANPTTPERGAMGSVQRAMGKVGLLEPRPKYRVLTYLLDLWSEEREKLREQLAAQQQRQEQRPPQG